MTKIKFNSFKKKPNTKTSYGLEQGEPIFGDKLYLVVPYFVHGGRSPSYSLVSHGKHLSGLYPHAGGGFTGDYKGKGLLIFLKPDGFDLFATDISPVELVATLQTQSMVEELFKARREAV